MTAFFGTNSAGKSSLLQFLLMLKQTKNATDRGLVLDFGGPSELVNLGTFQDVVHRHQEEQRIRWELEWTLPRLKISDPGSGRPLYEGDRRSTRCEVGLHRIRLGKRGLCPHELGYRFDGKDFSLRPRGGSATQYELVFDDQDHQPMRNRGRPKPLPQPVKTHLFPSEARIAFQNTDFLADFELEYEKLMDSIYYLGPLRNWRPCRILAAKNEGPSPLSGAPSVRC